MKYVLMLILCVMLTACGANKVLVKTKTCQAIDRHVSDVSECEEFNP